MGKVVRTYYESGELKSEVFVVNNKKNGEYKQY
jgi:antitoxin component YwqK of YwqJK toxin-antitoxin module